MGKTRTYEYEGVPVFRYELQGEQPTREECQARVFANGSELLLDWLRREQPDLLHVHTIMPSLNVLEFESIRAQGIRLVVTNHMPSLGYLCQRGTLMRWDHVPCDGQVRTFRCAACCLNAAGMPQWMCYPSAALSALLGEPATRLPGRAGTMLGMAAIMRRRRLLQARLLAAVDAFVVLNRGAYDSAIENGAPKEKVVINALGVSSTIQRKPPPEVQPVQLPVRFGYVGRFRSVKGIMDLANAWRSLPPNLPATLLWCGPALDAEARELTERLRSMFAKDERVTVTTNGNEGVPPDKVGQLLQQLDVLLVPSRSFENGPTVMYEAIAAGVPVVGTRMGAMPEVIRDRMDGRVLTPASPGELREAILEIVADPAGTADVWRHALPRARTMDDIAAEYEVLYAQIVNGQPLASNSHEAHPVPSG
jgi:glycosyltransferase involved in cell wall biosynthesis